MAKRFDPDFNSEIRRIVKNFNQKRNRAYRRGFSYLPNKAYVSDIKASFNTKGEIKKYLKELEKFNNMGDAALDIISTDNGGKISRYNLMFIKDNLKDTKAFFDRQIAEAEELFYEDQYSIARRDYLFNLQAKRKYLDLEIMQLDQSGLKTFDRYTKQALSYNKSNITAYKGFLSGVEDVMRRLGYDEKYISTFYEKMSNVSPAQFIKMYRKNDLIARIYEMIPSPEHGRDKINTDDDTAKEYINQFVKEFDDMVRKSTSGEEFVKETNKKYKEYEKQLAQKNKKKIPLSSLSQTDIDKLTTLGWMDLVDENE